MEPIPENITEFLKKNRVASISYTDEKGEPQCINCFFVYNEKHGVIIFKSAYGTAHEEFAQNPARAAGSVLPEQIDILKMRGIQFSGSTMGEKEINFLDLPSFYYKKYPFGRVLSGYIWAVKLDRLKFTDNTLGFGNKTLWSAQTDVIAV